MCTLRIWGRKLDVDGLLATLPFKPVMTHRRGEPQLRANRPGSTHETSGATFTVSQADGSELNAQISDALSFLNSYAEALHAARSFPGVEQLIFDFPTETRNVPVQCDEFPASLLAELASHAIDLAVSREPTT